MRTSNIKKFKKGWLIGDFEPSVFKNKHVEVAHHFHEANFIGERHAHMESTELTYIVRGKLVASGIELVAGDMWIYGAGEVSEVIFLEDTDLMVIRWPSIPDDKVMV